ncbi:MAG: DUF5683 domain-containing protein [bacterium]|nr:DUF5683 domain-containing protein [bacterium]
MNNKIFLVFFLLLVFSAVPAFSEEHAKEIISESEEAIPLEIDSEGKTEKEIPPKTEGQKENFGKKVERFFKVEVDIDKDPSLRDLPKPYYVGLRSLVIPGWGQFTNRKVLKGLGFISLEVACVLVFVHLDSVADERYEQHSFWIEQAINAYELGHYSEYEKLRDLADDRFEKYNQNFLGMRNVMNTGMVIWFLCGIDAYIDAHLRRYMQAEKLSVEVGMERNTPKLSFCYNF